MEPVGNMTVEQRLAAIEEKLDLVLARLGGLGLGTLGEVSQGRVPEDRVPEDRVPQDGIPQDRVPQYLPASDAFAPQALDPAYDPIVELVRQGRKIQAIKAYRERTGAGLRQAKDAIDAMALRERPQGRR